MCSEKPKEQSHILSDVDIKKATAMLYRFTHTEFKDYNRPQESSCTWIMNNHKRRTMKAHDLRGVKCCREYPSDPLVKVDKKGQVEDDDQPEGCRLTDATPRAPGRRFRRRTTRSTSRSSTGGITCTATGSY